MASQNKQKKCKGKNCNKTMLKFKKFRCKRVGFFTSSQRRLEKQKAIRELEFY